MYKLMKTAMLTLAFALVATTAIAQDPAATAAGAGAAATGFSMNLGSAVGAGMVIIGAGLGIGKIGSVGRLFKGVLGRAIQGSFPDQRESSPTAQKERWIRSLRGNDRKRRG